MLWSDPVPLSDSVPGEWPSAFGIAERAALASLDGHLKGLGTATRVLPPRDKVFEAMRLTPLSAVRAVILGQDPYPTRGHAHGLAFSVPTGVHAPRSLRNIQREYVDDLKVPPPISGSLEPWARHGILLLNTVLTVREGEVGSHRGLGWEVVTECWIKAVADRPDPIAFLLWGRAAREHGRDIDRTRHVVIESPHPSPLSARLGFFGSRPFSRANKALADRGVDPIEWDVLV